MSVVRSPVRSVVRSPVRGVFGGSASLIDDARAYLAGIAPYHWFDFVNDRCLYASNDVGGVSGATGYSFSRASTGYYTNADGTLTSFASGALRRGNRGVLIEGARTNLLLRSTFAGGGSVPTGWTQPSATGTSTPSTSTLNADVVAYTHVATAQRPYFNQDIALASNTTYTVSVYIEAVTGTVALSDFMGFVSLPTGATATADSLGNLAAGQRRTIVVSGTYTGDTRSFRVGLGILAVATGTVRFSMPQIEAASFPSSYIPTTTASATRAADVLTCTAGVSYPIRMFAEFERAVDTGGNETLIALDDTTTNNRTFLRVASTDVAQIDTVSGGAAQAAPVTVGALAINTVHKMAGRVSTNSVQICANGTLGTEDTSATNPADGTVLRFGLTSAAANPPFGYIRRAAVIQGAGVDADLTAMTS